MKVAVWIEPDEARRLFRLGKLWFKSSADRDKILKELFDEARIQD